MPVYEEEPGFLMDLIFICILQCNSVDSSDFFINPLKQAEDHAFFETIKEIFPSLNHAFSPFFYREPQGSCFMGDYFTKFIDSTKACTFEDFCAGFSRHEEICSDVIRHYLFTEADDLDLGNLQAVSLRIMRLDIPDGLKAQLLYFIINPKYVIENLLTDFKLKAELLREYYIQNPTSIQSPENVDWDLLCDDFKNHPDLLFDLRTYKFIKYSVCRIYKNVLFSRLYDNSIFLLLGYDIETYNKFIRSNDEPFEMQDFCKALSDSRRVAVFNLLIEHVEMSTSMISSQMKISLTNLMHHLAIMVNADILFQRFEGRTVFYSLKQDQIERAGLFFLNVIKDYGGSKDEKVEHTKT